MNNKGECMLKKYQEKFIAFIWFSLAIIGTFIEPTISFGGMSLVEFIILFSEFMLIFKKRKMWKIKKIDFLIFTYLLILIAISSFFCDGYFFLLRDLRNLILIIGSYCIFRDCSIDGNKLLKIFFGAGALNSILYLLSGTSLSARNISVILFISLISFNIGLFFTKQLGINKVIIYTVVLLNAFVILISQTRSLIVCIGVTGMIYFGENIKKLEIHRILFILLLCIGVIYSLEKLGLLDIVVKRFDGEMVTGEKSTLVLRIDSVLYNFREFSWYNYLFGKGLGKTIIYYHNFSGIDRMAVGTELEMFIPNYIMKIGIVPIFFLMLQYIKRLMKIIHKNMPKNRKKILYIFFSVISGGMISGLSGMEGGIIFAMLIGIMVNPNIMINE